MKLFQTCFTSLALLAAGTLAGCSSSPKTPDVAQGIRKSLDTANLQDVSVSQDRDKGVVTLTSHVAADNDKFQAESIARAQAPGQVVSNEIVVTPPGAQSDANAVKSDLDKGIKNNLDAALIQHGMHDAVKYEVKSGVVTLTGDVHSEAARTQAQSVAAAVPNVQQVVNEIQVTDQRASSTR